MRLGQRGREIAFGGGLLATVALGLGLAEALATRHVARLKRANVDWEGMMASAGATKDADEMIRFRPHARFGRIVFNDRGFRGPVLAVPAPARTVRIAFLGDSKVFGADHPEARTLAAQTTARLAAAVPSCRFDYVTLAGPGYTLGYLAQVWRDMAPAVRPDLGIVLAGSAMDLVKFHDARARPGATILPPAVEGARPRPSLAAQSVFLTLVGRELALASPVAGNPRTEALPWPALAASYRQMATPLVTATQGTPMLAIGYRSLLRGDRPAAARAHASRQLRQSIPGLSIAGAVALSDSVVGMMTGVARDAGWGFIDPIAAIPGDRAHFLDRTHFTDRGLALLAAAVAAEVAPRVTADCRIAPRI